MPMIERKRPAAGEPASVVMSAPAAGAEAINTLELVGDFDMAIAHELDRAIADEIDAGGRHFVIDLRAVTFLGGSALNALVRGRKRALRRNGQLVLVRPPARIWRLFVLTRLCEAFPAFASPDAALQYLSSARN